MSDFQKSLDGFRIDVQESLCITPSNNFPGRDLKSLQLELQTTTLKYKTQIFDMQSQIFSQSSQISNLQSLISKYFLDRTNDSSKLLHKKQKIHQLKQQLHQQSEKFSSDLQEIQRKSHESFQDLSKNYSKDIQSLSKLNNSLKRDLESLKKSSKSESFKIAAEILAKEKKNFIKKLSQAALEKNEANAKLEILREELRTVNSFFQEFSRESVIGRMDSVIKSAEELSLKSEDMNWLITNLSFLKEDFDKTQLALRLHDRIIAQKNQEIQELRVKAGLPKRGKVSPGNSKVQTASCSPTSAMSGSFFRNFSPKHVPSYSFQEDTNKVLGNDLIISEFAGLKLKYALLQEFIMTRDNDFRILMHELKRRPEGVNEFIEFIYKKIEETQEYLD